MKVLIIDDDKLVCSSLKIILDADPEITVVGIGYDGETAIKLFKSLQPDVLLMDIRMSNLSGLEAGEMILKDHSKAKILYLTTFLDDDYIIKALNIGAKGYMLKQNFDCIIPSIKAVYTNQNVYGNEIVSKLPSLMNQNNRPPTYIEDGISKKEYSIIVQIAEGLSNKEIADLLYLSEGTVRNYISVILEKLDLRDRTQIAIYYYRN